MLDVCVCVCVCGVCVCFCVIFSLVIFFMHILKKLIKQITNKKQKNKQKK